MEKTNISVIIPVHELNEETKQLLNNAVQSVADQTVRPDELIIVVPKGSETAKTVKSADFGDLKKQIVIAENDGETDFASQVNYGVSVCKTEWFSILEFDDEYAKIWFKNVKSYIEVYPEVDAFLPIVVDVDSKMVFAGFTNEATFAANFSQEMGYLTNETLLNYQNFQTSGMVFKKLIVEDFGGFKPSFKLTFPYEFLLRMTYNSAKIMTIPKIGYKHMNLREGSLFWEYKNGENKVGESEVQFWVSSAKKEYFFSTDRNIKYSQENA